ncbi:MAG: lytic transglycosylase [Comamonadaceae bacterium PBBC2]|nr:MAG: lytic transglycosylase [Comamonadaceae bacterium PBBC2]
MTANTQLARLWLVLRTLVRDVRDGFVEISRHSLALVGLVVVAVTLTFLARPGLQLTVNEVVLEWLEMRQADSMDPPTNDAAYRSTATSVKGLPKNQLAITYWLSRRYRVSPEPIAALVTEAWEVGERSQIAPTLLLAIMAIESKFNPFTAGTQGAMGLMQIDPEARATELSPFGGRLAVFDPVTNLRVGARHLQDLMLQSETIEEALRQYAVSSGQSEVGPYVDRVLNEQKLLDKML